MIRSEGNETIVLKYPGHETGYHSEYHWISPRMGWVYPRWWAEITRGDKHGRWQMVDILPECLYKLYLLDRVP
jgi:hypothetical protein